MTSTDESLREGIRAGDAEAYRQLLHAMAPRLVSYGRALGLSSEDAEDVAQSTFISLYRTRSSLRADGELRALCYRVATNLGRNRLRDLRLRARREGEAAVLRAGMAEHTSEDDSLGREAWGMVAALDEEERMVLTLSIAHGLTRSEIALVLGIPEGTVSTRKNAALKTLRGRLASSRGMAAPMPALPLAEGLAEAMSRASEPFTLSAAKLQSMENIVMVTVGTKSVSGIGIVIAAILLVGGVLATWFVLAHDDPASNAYREAQTTAMQKGTGRTSPARTSGSKSHGTGNGQAGSSSALPVATEADDAVAKAPLSPSSVPMADPSTESQSDTVLPAPPPIAPSVQPSSSTTAASSVDPSTIILAISGKVVDPNGIPVSHASVEVVSIDFSTAPVLLERTTADTGGLFSVTFTPRSLAQYPEHRFFTVHVSAQHPDNFPVPMPLYFTIESGKSLYEKKDVTITMSIPVRVECEVVDHNGKPVAGADCFWCGQWHLGEGSQVIQWIAMLRMADGSYAQARTDERGIALLAAPSTCTNSVNFAQAGLAIFVARKDGFSEGMSEQHDICLNPSGTPTRVRIVMSEGGSATLELRDEQGLPIADTQATLSPQDVGKGTFSLGDVRTLQTYTDATGKGKLSGLPGVARRYTLRAVGYGLVEVEYLPGMETISATLRSGSTVSIRFRDVRTGDMLKSFSTTLSLGGQIIHSADNYREQVEIECLSPGQYELKGRLYGVMGERTFPVVVGTEAEQSIILDVPLSGATVVGKVLTSSGAAIEQAWISCQGSRKQDEHFVPISAYGSTRSRAEGSFFMTGLGADVYSISVQAPGFATSTTSVTATGKEGEILTVELRLMPSMTFLYDLPAYDKSQGWGLRIRAKREAETENEGWTIDPASLPMEGAMHRYDVNVSDPFVVWIQSTDYASDYIPNDPYAVRLLPEAGKTLQHSFANVPLVTLEIMLRDEDGVPVSGLSCYLRRIDPRIKASELSVSLSGNPVTSDAQGRIVAHGLVPGRYALLTYWERPHVVFDVDVRAEQSVVIEPGKAEILSQR